MQKRVLAVVVLSMVGAVQADEVIYRSQDADGKPSFSDRPAAGAKPVELPPVNTVPAQPAPAPARTQIGETPVTDYRVALSAPSTVANGLVPTPVGIEVEPALQPGHRWQLVLDGEVVAEGEGNSHSLDSMSRGPHELSVQVVDHRGSVLGSDGPVRIFVLRPGKN